MNRATQKTNTILIYTESDAGFAWLEGVLAGSADRFEVRRVARAEDLRDAAASTGALVIYEEGEREWQAASWAEVRERLEGIGASRLIYLSAFDFSSHAREAAFLRRIHYQRRPCGATELLRRVEDLAFAPGEAVG